MSRDIVGESSAMTVIARFDSLPFNVRYRIKDLTNDRVVRDWTDVPPAREVEIAVIASDNAVHAQNCRVYEERAFVVQANYDTDTQIAKEKRYLVEDLRGID